MTYDQGSNRAVQQPLQLRKNHFRREIITDVRPIEIAVWSDDLHFVERVHHTREQCKRANEKEYGFEKDDKVLTDELPRIREHLSKGSYLFKL
jgi:hypothetical protein